MTIGKSEERIKWEVSNKSVTDFTGKNSRFPFLDILEYLTNTHKNTKFGKVRQVPTREFPTKFSDWDLSHSSKFRILWGFFKYPKISKNGNLLFFPVFTAVQIYKYVK